MPNYNEAQGVADLLSKFDFNIISEVPHLFPDPSAAERFCTYQGVPGDLLRPAMEKARAEYEKVKAHQSPEKAVSLKGEVETARGASAAMADNGNHSNRGQDAR